VTDFALAGTVLTRDLVSASGKLVASRGEIADLGHLKEVAARAPRNARQRALHETKVSEAVLESFDAAPLQHLAGPPDARAQIADALCEVRFPDEVWEELDALREEDAVRFQHAVWTAVVAARLFRAALGEAPGLSRLVGGALVHDIGMRHAAQRLRLKRDHLTANEALTLEDHPIVGALVLASALGDAPAVHFALLHHTRAGFGYPRVAGKPPLRGLDLVAVASAFAALVAPRPFRQQAFNARGAADQLCDEATAGYFDGRAVRLLIHCMRGAKGPMDVLKLPRTATGFRPTRNHHGVTRDQAQSSA
jgi:HD-GYP domain-containing protein (c-di-GMP phosphodiesterase class II)